MRRLGLTRLGFALLLGAGGAGPARSGEPAPPFEVADGLFDFSRPDTLGLAEAPGTKTVTIFRAQPGALQYSNGAVPVAFGERLYVQWQSSARDEDSPDTRILYSRSDDGTHWSEPRELAASGDGVRRSPGGWWTDGRRLVAFVNEWPGSPEGGGHAVWRESADGEHWSPAQPVRDHEGAPVDGIIEQDPHALPDGRIIVAFHLRPGVVAAPFYTDDPTARGGWVRARFENLPHDGAQSRELEPSSFRRVDGAVVMVFRDQVPTYRQLAAVSRDRGVTWTQAGLTAMPDSRAKQSAGNFPDGTAFLVNAPSGNRERFPLVVTISRDGTRFDRAWLLRAGGAGLAPMRFPGRFKRPGYHYPKSAVWHDRLVVAYTANKEDVELTSVPLASFAR
ncbi:MAG TPA: sialidase family protein [Lacunisphaera sp.]|nr:sialidase family protein [Lacunisphaera sp.]